MGAYGSPVLSCSPFGDLFYVKSSTSENSLPFETVIGNNISDIQSSKEIKGELAKYRKTPCNNHKMVDKLPIFNPN